MTKRMWHILRVKPGFEIAVAAILPWCHAYLPIATTKHVNRRSRTVRIGHKPVFSGYVFLQLASIRELDLSPFRSKAFGFLKDGRGTPLTLTEEEIEWMMRLEEDLYKVPVKDASAMFEIGQRVALTKLADGALSGIVKSVYADRVTVEVPGPFKPLTVSGDALRTLDPV